MFFGEGGVGGMGAQYVLSIDQGTTGSTALVVAFEGGVTRIVGRETVEFPQMFPRSGWVEHDLDAIWGSVRKAVTRALEKASVSEPGFSARRLLSIGITNQRETLCVFDRKTSAALRRAIVWQCRRSTQICERVKAEGHEAMIRERTGLVVDPYFSGSKLAWIFEHEPDLKSLIESGTAAVGTIDTFLLHRLTGAQVYATESSNASRTMLFDCRRGAFDGELARALGLPPTLALPEVKDSSGVFGKTSGLDFLPDGIPVTGMLGDQQAALAGQACFSKGEAKCTYGTGAFLLLNTGRQMLSSRAGMLSTVAWRLNGEMTYALEGASFIAGAAVQFLRDQMKFIAASSEIEALASKASAAPQLYFVPALAGLGAPWWDAHARGAFLGMTRGTTREQLCRAALEGIAFQVNDLLTSMASDLGGTLSVLRVDGGAAANDLLMRAQADLSRVPVDRPANLETTALGAAMMAALGAGVFSGVDEMNHARVSEKIFEPRGDDVWTREREVWIKRWTRAIESVRLFGAGV
jgi:glycerol kinase